MSVVVDDSDFTLHVGDALSVLRGLPDESVHCVVTSPPYWGLRDYGTGSWDGGNEDCDHKAPPTGGPNPVRYTTGGGEMFRAANDKLERHVCGKCGARRTDNQLGLEPTPDLYVARMVEVFREVRRVLRRDGTCWLNIGDSYASGGGAGNQGENGQMASRSVSSARITRPRGGLQGGTATVDVSLGGGRGAGLKPKDLVGIPWRLAFALQADGWYLRSDIIWSKPNPMPESVTDRPTKAHEYLFLLTKSARYFYDADAIREPATYFGPNGSPATMDGDNNSRPGEMRSRAGRKRPLVPEQTKAGVGRQGLDSQTFGEPSELGRNKRSVWEIATQPYPQAHFATFPEALVEPCVLAGTSERGCCPVCGAPWERETERTPNPDGIMGSGNHRETVRFNPRAVGRSVDANAPLTTDWRPTCECSAEGSSGPVRGYGRELGPLSPAHPSVPCTVLDPFMGSGTTALVARRLGRKTIGVELSLEYAQLAATRLQQLSLLAEPA